MIAKYIICRLGCINGNGAEYKGFANVSVSGRICLRWNDPTVIRSGFILFSSQVSIAALKEPAEVKVEVKLIALRST